MELYMRYTIPMSIRLRQCSRIAVYLFTGPYVDVAYISNQSIAAVCIVRCRRIRGVFHTGSRDVVRRGI
jgi:hypothetical protein